MLASQRQARITDEVRRVGGVRVSDLTELLGVSDMTIRRDLEVLARSGVLHKVHGGAILGEARRRTEEPGFEAKSSLQQPAKEAIAARAAELINPGTAIALSAGTTTWMLARYITAIPGLTVVTNSTTVADVLARQPQRADFSVILTGGVRTPSAALVGPVADQAIRSLHVDQLFIGVHGMDAEAGFTTPNLAEAQTNRVLIASAREVVVMADSTKWATVGLADFGPLSVADVLITDGGLSEEAHEQLAESVGELIVAEDSAQPDLDLL
jgi:DeoR/GlpR family transcriptional regulator of sugar metabolism